MTREELLSHCREEYGTEADYPFEEDFQTAVLRHSASRKWYALLMRVSRRKFGQDSDEVIDVVNLKLPVELRGSFTPAEGVYPAYHMNKLHWISVLLPDAGEETVTFLLRAGYRATAGPGKGSGTKKSRRRKSI